MFKSTDGGLSFPAGNALTYSNANILSTEGVVSFTGAKENGITKFSVRLFLPLILRVELMDPM